jgi:hypothetical protein
MLIQIYLMSSPSIMILHSNQRCKGNDDALLSLADSDLRTAIFTHYGEHQQGITDTQLLRDPCLSVTACSSNNNRDGNKSPNNSQRRSACLGVNEENLAHDKSTHQY